MMDELTVDHEGGEVRRPGGPPATPPPRREAGDPTNGTGHALDRPSSPFIRTRRGIAFVAAGVAPFGLAYLTATYVMPGDWVPLLFEILALYGLYVIALYWAFPRRHRSPKPRNDADTVPVNERGQRTDWLLLLRGIAAALVFVMHTGIVFKHDFQWGGSRWAWIAFSPAWLGMILFFTLSGYLMGKGFKSGKYPLDRRGVSHYLRNRFLRIVPLSLVVAAAIIVLQAPSWIGQPDLIIRTTSFTFNGIVSPEGLGSYWSLSTEWQFYLVAPIAALVCFFLFRRRAILPATVAAVMIAGVGIRWILWVRHDGIIGWNPFVYTPLYGNIDLFILGFVANWIRPNIQRLSGILRRTWAPILLAIYLAYSYVSYRAMELGDVGIQKFFAVVMPAIVALFLLPVLLGMEASNDAANLRPTSTRSRLRSRTLYWIGALTFPVYLCHSAILVSVESGIPRSPYLTRLLVAAVLTFATALILHLTVERTALSWRIRLGQRSPAPRQTDRVAEPL